MGVFTSTLKWKYPSASVWVESMVVSAPSEGSFNSTNACLLPISCPLMGTLVEVPPQEKEKKSRETRKEKRICCELRRGAISLRKSASTIWANLAKMQCNVVSFIKILKKPFYRRETISHKRD